MENFKLFKIPEVQYLDFEVISEENMFYLNLIEVYLNFVNRDLELNKWKS